MRDIIKRVIREESETKKDALKSVLTQSGIEFTSKLMGGIDNVINVLYDGDIMKYSEDTHTPLAYMSETGMVFYLHAALVEKLGLKNFSRRTDKEKELGDFTYGRNNGLKYKFTARLYPVKLMNEPYYKVVGLSGDSGFGYSFINQRNTLGKRSRQQIYKQIIDKYNLEPYMKVNTFY